jgi:TrmH family RNA methyltransferase
LLFARQARENILGRGTLIESRGNEKLRLVRKLLAARKHRDESGLFAVENEDLVDAAATAGIEPVELLVAGENIVPELLAEVSTLGHAPRVIGVYRRSDLPAGGRNVVVGLWQVSDPGNIGTLMRTADAFGAGVALSDGCADPTGPRAVRASAGAIFRVPVLGWDELPERCVGLVARGGEPLADVKLEPPLAFLLGAEREGLPEALATTCHKVTIPTPGDAESLNVAAAGAIALYELHRRASVRTSTGDPGQEGRPG